MVQWEIEFLLRPSPRKMSSVLVEIALLCWYEVRLGRIVTVMKGRNRKWTLHWDFRLISTWYHNFSFHSNVINLHQESSLNPFALFSMLPFTCCTKKKKKSQLALRWIFHVNASGSNTNIFIVRLITSGLTFCKSCLVLGRIFLLLMRSGKLCSTDTRRKNTY